MSYKPGGTLVEQFLTIDETTKELTAPDELPTAVLTRNGADDGAVTLTVSLIETGRYKVTGTIPTDYAEGDVIQVVGTAVINTDETSSIVSSDVLDVNVYHADVQLTIDNGNTRDEYTATWFKNGVPVTSGITTPLIQVIKRANGTDLIASTAMTAIASTGALKYDEATNRMTAGEAIVVVVTATIDGSARVWRRVVYRDV